MEFKSHRYTDDIKPFHYPLYVECLSNGIAIAHIAWDDYSVKHKISIFFSKEMNVGSIDMNDLNAIHNRANEFIKEVEDWKQNNQPKKDIQTSLKFVNDLFVSEPLADCTYTQTCFKDNRPLATFSAAKDKAFFKNMFSMIDFPEMEEIIEEARKFDALVKETLSKTTKVFHNNPLQARVIELEAEVKRLNQLRGDRKNNEQIVASSKLEQDILDFIREPERYVLDGGNLINQQCCGEPKFKVGDIICYVYDSNYKYLFYKIESITYSPSHNCNFYSYVLVDTKGIVTNGDYHSGEFDQEGYMKAKKVKGRYVWPSIFKCKAKFKVGDVIEYIGKNTGAGLKASFEIKKVGYSKNISEKREGAYYIVKGLCFPVWEEDVRKKKIVSKKKKK